MNSIDVDESRIDETIIKNEESSDMTPIEPIKEE